MRLPDFIIIGAMKCATSTLHEQLAVQTGIFMSTPKEPNFFSDDAIFTRGMEWYTSLFRGASSSDVCGESSTHYTKRPNHTHTLQRMVGALPESVRFVYVMRHPIDRLVSQYIHEWTQNAIRSDIDDAIERHPELVDYGRYHYQLSPYFEAFGRQRVLPVFFEDIQQCPQQVLQCVARFVGLKSRPQWHDDLPAQNVSAERMRRSRTRDLIMNAPGATWIRRHCINQRIRDRIKQCWKMRERPQPSPAVIQRVCELYDREFDALSEWLGVKLTCASYHEQIAARTINSPDALEDAA